MFIQPINENEIIEVINDLKLKKGGIDKINASHQLQLTYLNSTQRLAEKLRCSRDS